jgi:hypothetical protein
MSFKNVLLILIEYLTLREKKFSIITCIKINRLLTQVSQKMKAHYTGHINEKIILS